MSEDLIVSTPDEYMKLLSRKVKVSSGAVFHIGALGADSVVYLLRTFTGVSFEGEGKDDFIEFVKDHLAPLKKHIIMPSIIAPEIPSDKLLFMDAFDLLLNIIDIEGLTQEGVEKREGFREEPDGTDP